MSKSKNSKSVNEKHIKFDFPDFSGSSFIPYSKANTQSEIDNALDKVISSHFAHIDSDNTDVQDANEQEEIEQEELRIDIESIKNEAYANGYSDAEEQLQKTINEYKVDYDIANSLNEKIKSINVVDTIDMELLSVFSQSLKSIADNMYLKLPVNFDKIVTGLMLDFIKQHYENGGIKILVHTTKVEYCKNILAAEKLPEDRAGALNIVGSDDIELNGCVVELKETKLVYSPEQIQENINKIISELNIEGS